MGFGNKVKGFFKKIGGGLKKAASWTWDKVKRIGKGIGKGVKKIATPVVNVVKKGVSAAGKLIGKGAKWVAENPEKAKAIVSTAVTVGKAIAGGGQFVYYLSKNNGKDQCIFNWCKKSFK